MVIRRRKGNSPNLYWKSSEEFERKSKCEILKIFTRDKIASKSS